jgi:IS30 family transposase
MKIYFSHPNFYWELGTNRNTNIRIKKSLPKGTNFHEIDLKKLQPIKEKLNI